MNHYVIRLNVQPCDNQFMWRVWENDIEIKNASKVLINVPSYTETSIDTQPDRFEGSGENQFGSGFRTMVKKFCIGPMNIPEINVQ